MKETEISTVALYLQKPNTILKDLQTSANQIPLNELPLFLLESNEDEAGGEDYSSLRNLIGAYLNTVNSKLFQLVCVEFDYCLFKKEKIEDTAIVKLIGDSLISILAGVPLPTITLIAYLLEAKYFDSLCGCNKKKLEQDI